MFSNESREGGRVETNGEREPADLQQPGVFEVPVGVDGSDEASVNEGREVGLVEVGLERGERR